MKIRLKRFSAFLIDILVIGLFLMLIYYFIPERDTTIIQNNITEVTEQVLNNEIGKIDYLKEFSKNIYELDRGNVLFNAFNTLIIMLYFILVPIITKGYTLGMYISGVKIKGKLNVKNLLLRNLIATGLIYLILSVILVYLTSNMTYFIILSILGIIQFLLVIISTFMIIYRSDLKGIQDIISSTEIVQTKEVKE